MQLDGMATVGMRSDLDGPEGGAAIGAGTKGSSVGSTTSIFRATVEGRSQLNVDSI
jgi:hypothetical protein